MVWEYFKTNTSNAFIAKLALFGERPQSHIPFPTFPIHFPFENREVITLLTSDMSNLGVSGTTKPIIPELAIFGQCDGLTYEFNSRGHHGVVLLTRRSLDVMNACQQGRNIHEMLGVIPWTHDEPEALLRVLKQMADLELIELTSSYSEQLRQNRKKARKKTFYVWLQSTDSCNLACSYCYIEKTPMFMQYDLARYAISEAKKSAAKHGFDEIVFKLAGGEPTLSWKMLSKLLQQTTADVNDQGIAVRFNVITNGVILPQEMLDLASEGQISISLSLDGIGYWHDIQRPLKSGSGSFRLIDANIERMLVRGVRPYILTTVTHLNSPGLSELAEYCITRDLGFRFSFYREVASSPKELENDNLLLSQHLGECYEWIHDHMPDTSLYRLHRFGDMNLKVPKTRSCGIASKGMTVDTQGMVSICQYEMSKPVGRVGDSDMIETILNQTLYDPVAGRVDNIPVCRDCNWRYVCGSGCPMLTQRFFGTYLHSSPYCQMYRTVLPVLVELHAAQLVHYMKGGVKDA